MAGGLRINEGTGKIVDSDQLSREAEIRDQQVTKLSLGSVGVFQKFLEAGQLTAANSISVVQASDSDWIKAEDTAHTTGDKGVMALSVRTDTAFALAANGDYAPLQTDGNGRLHVVLSAAANQPVNVAQINGVAPSMGNGASGTGVQRVTLANDSTGVIATVSTVTNVTTVATLTNITNWGNIVDNAGFTDGTTRLSMNGYIYDDVAGTALTENDAAAARIDSKRAQVMVIEDGTTRARAATVKAASTAPVASDTALVVAVSPNSAELQNPSTVGASLSSGFKTVALIGTPEALAASSTLVQSLIIKAYKSRAAQNTGLVWIGHTSTNDAQSYPLSPGDSLAFEAPPGKKIDLNTIFLDVETAGDGVTFFTVN